MKNKRTKLQRLIEESPYTYDQLRVLVKCSVGQLSKVASGKAKPHEDLAFRICDFFGHHKINPFEFYYTPRQIKRIKKGML